VILLSFNLLLEQLVLEQHPLGKGIFVKVELEFLVLVHILHVKIRIVHLASLQFFLLLFLSQLFGVVDRNTLPLVNVLNSVRNWLVVGINEMWLQFPLHLRHVPDFAFFTNFQLVLVIDVLLLHFLRPSVVDYFFVELLFVEFQVVLVLPLKFQPQVAIRCVYKLRKFIQVFSGRHDVFLEMRMLGQRVFKSLQSIVFFSRVVIPQDFSLFF